MKRFLWVFAALLAAAYVVLPGTAQARPVDSDGEPITCWIGRCLAEEASQDLPVTTTVVPTITVASATPTPTVPALAQITSTMVTQITQSSTVTEPVYNQGQSNSPSAPQAPATSTPLPTFTSTATATETATPEPSATPTWTPTLRPWPTATPIGTVAPTFTAISTATWTATNTMVPTSTATATPDLRPAITSVSTNEAHPGDWVVIRGRNFLVQNVLASQLQIWLAHDNGGVYWWGINSNTGKPISPDFWDQDSIQFQIPPDAPSQSGRLYVVVGNKFAQYDQRFTISRLAPTATASPTATRSGGCAYGPGSDLSFLGGNRNEWRPTSVSYGFEFTRSSGTATLTGPSYLVGMVMVETTPGNARRLVPGEQAQTNHAWFVCGPDWAPPPTPPNR